MQPPHNMLSNPRPVAYRMRWYRRISNWRSMGYIVLDYLIIGSVAVVAHRLHNLAFTVLAWIVIATRQVALRNLTHAASHYALFEPKQWNDRVDWLISFATIDAVGVYRRGHLTHHMDYTKARESRFDYLHKTLGLPKLGFVGRTWVVFIRPLLGQTSWDYTARNRTGYSFLKLTFPQISDVLRQVKATPRFGKHLVTYWLLVFTVMWWFGWLMPFLEYWLVPLFWFFPILNMWATISDHFQVAGAVGRNHCGLFYELVLKPHELYHDVHHSYPYIPFYRLASAFRYLNKQGEVTPTSSGLKDFLRTIYPAELSRE